MMDPRAEDDGKGRASRQGVMRATVVSKLADVGVWPQAWNTLAAASPTNSVFQTHEWMCAWWTAYQHEYDPLFVVVQGAEGIVGFAPMVRRNGERVIRFLGEGRADYCDFLLTGEPRSIIALMFDALAQCISWDVIDLTNLPAESATVEALRDVCRQHGYRMLIADHYVCPTLLVDGHEESARRIINKPSVRRRLNYFTRAGQLVTRDLTSAADVEPYLDAFFAQHIDRWKGSGSPSLFLDSKNQAFYRELTTRLSNTGWLLFSVAELDGEPIAFHYGFDYNGSVVWYKPTFNRSVAAHSPGIVMVRHLISYALDRGRKELDFTIGDEAFKQRFTNSARKTVQIQIFRDPVHFHLYSWRRKVRATLRTLAR